MEILEPTRFPLSLEQVTLFSPLPSTVLSQLYECGEYRRYTNGEALFGKGDQTQEAYVILGGVVEICRLDPDAGDLRPVAYLGPGDTIGEMVLFTGTPRSSVARVPEEAFIFAISKTGLIELCRREPDLALYFCRLFASRLEAWVKKGRRQESRKQLEGNLNYFDLATVMQTLGDTQSTGALLVKDRLGRTVGELEFREGRLLHARLGHLRSEEAFFQLFLPAPEGTFHFQGGTSLDGDVGPIIDQSIVGLLMDAMRLQDEWQVIRDEFRDGALRFRPIAKEIEWTDDETIVVANDIWSLIHQQITLGDLFETLPYCTASILIVLKQLENTGQLRAVRDMDLKGA